MKRTLILIVRLLAARVFAAAQPNIGIGAWNIQWLGNPEQRSGCGKDVRQSAEDLAMYISRSRVDILALEEISDTDGDPRKPAPTPRSTA